MGIILNKAVDKDVIEEFQNCNLYPHDTHKIKQLFHEFRTQRINAKDGKHFGLRINAQQLTEWKHCTLADAQKLISRWKPTIGIKKSNTKQLLAQLNESNTIDNDIIPSKQRRRDRQRQKRQNSLRRSLSAIQSPINVEDIQNAYIHVHNENMKDDTEISILPLFCAMVLLSSGTVSEKLKLIINLFVNNPHDSVSRKKLDVIIENTILALVVLLDMKRYIDKLRRNAHRHIYQKNCNNSTTFKEISRGSLAVWLATSPYVLHVFCLRNTSDVSERYVFLHKFYNDHEKEQNADGDMNHNMTMRPSVSFKIDRRSSVRRSTLFGKSRYSNASVPNLAAIDSSLRGTHLDFHKEQSINLTYKSLSKSWSAAQLRRNLSDDQHGLKRGKRDPQFSRVDSNVTMYSRKSLGNKRKDGGQQYYGGAVPFDSPPVTMSKLLNNFNKHYNLALKIQSRIRAPALVNKNNAKSVVDGFVALSNGKETIEKEDVLLKGHQTVVVKTLERIFVKCDIKGSHSIDIREFLMSQFGSANDEELDRAMSYNEKMPRVYGWTIQCLKVLFDKVAKEKYGFHQRGNQRRSRLFLSLRDDVDEQKEAEIKMSDFYALIIHCKELRQYVIRTTRLKRSKSKQMVNFKQACYMIFKECRGFHPESKKYQVVWSWVMKTEPGLNEEQIVQLKLLFDTMEQKADGTISSDQLENATEWIYPGIFTESLLPYLFYKFHRKQDCVQRINCDDFIYIMGYVWCIFQNDFKRRKANKTMLDSKFSWIHRFRSTLTPSQTSRISASFRKVSQPKKKSLSRKLTHTTHNGPSFGFSMGYTGGGAGTRDTSISIMSKKSSKTNTTIDRTVFFDDSMDVEHAEIVKYAKEIKDTIKKAGDFSELGLSQKMKRYWSNVLSQPNAEQAWIRLVLLSIRMVLNNHKHHELLKDESLFGYIKVLKDVDHHCDFRNTQFYTVPKA